MSTSDEKRIEKQRRRFHELGRQREQLLKELEPLQAERDALVQEHEPKMRVLHKKIKALLEPLSSIDRERGYIVRGLSGKTGTPEEYADKAE